MCVCICGLFYILYTLFILPSCLHFLYTLLEKNAAVSCMDLFFNSGRWRYICQSGCEDRIYCPMVSAQDEDCDNDGTRGRTTLPAGAFLAFAAAMKEEGAPRVAITTSGCKTRKNSHLEKLQKHVYGTVLNCRWFESYPLELNVVARKSQAKLYFVVKINLLQSLALLSYCC